MISEGKQDLGIATSNYTNRVETCSLSDIVENMQEVRKKKLVTQWIMKGNLKPATSVTKKSIS